jgi:hypothetical protein
VNLIRECKFYLLLIFVTIILFGKHPPPLSHANCTLSGNSSAVKIKSEGSELTILVVAFTVSALFRLMNIPPQHAHKRGSYCTNTPFAGYSSLIHEVLRKQSEKIENMRMGILIL